MNKIKTVKIKNLDGSVSEETYTISVDAKEVDMSNGRDLQETIGTINIDEDGNISEQLKNLDDNKIDKIYIVDNLESTETNKALSANQGRELKEITESLNNDIKKKAYFFNTVNDMKIANLKVGDYVCTKGYYSVNDGGAGEYEIVNNNSLVDDGGSVHNLANGLKAKLIFKNEINIKQFGAKGNGTTNDTIAVQNAFSFKGQLPVKIIFGEGQFNIKDTIFLYSNTEVDLMGATIFDCSDIIDYGNGSLRFLNSIQNLSSGYGALKNIIFKNGKIDGNNKSVLFGLLHCDNFQIDNIEFTNCVNDNHLFDFGGCRNILIENSKFNGFIYNASYHKEVIQIDYAEYSALPYWVSLGYLIQSQIGYDDLPTQNVTINNCIFEKGTQSNYPVIIGNDGPLGNVVHDNIHFSNNKINGFDKRAINLFCMQNVFIENNEIIDYSTSESYFLLANPSLQVNTTNLFVIGNSYKMTSNSKGIFLNIRNYVENPNKNDKIIISNNNYQGGYDGVTWGTGADFIQMSNISNAIISNNIINKPKNLYIATETNGHIAWLNNIIDGYRSLETGRDTFTQFFARNNLLIDKNGNITDWNNERKELYRGEIDSGVIQLTDNITKYNSVDIQSGYMNVETYMSYKAYAYGDGTFRLGDIINVESASGIIKLQVDATDGTKLNILNNPGTLSIRYIIASWY